MPTQTNLSLEDIVTQVAEVYPDQYLMNQLDHYPPEDFEALKPEEALAAYLFKEFSDLYDTNSSSDANLERITTSLERTLHLLGQVTERLKALDGSK